MGAYVETYLLEKARVTSQATGEQTYHIFYQMMAGASSAEREVASLQGRMVNLSSRCWQEWCLNGPFKFLPEDAAIEGLDMAEEFAKVKAAFGVLGVSEEEQAVLYSLLAGVLHLGNVDFEATVSLRGRKCAQSGLSLHVCIIAGLE